MSAVETVRIHVDVHLDWRDRLRVLFGRVIHVRVSQGVWVKNNVIGCDQATSSVYVESIRQRKPIGGGYEAVAPTDAPPAQEGVG